MSTCQTRLQLESKILCNSRERNNGACKVKFPGSRIQDTLMLHGGAPSSAWKTQRACHHMH